MNNNDQQELQKLLDKKQQWIQRAIKELQKGNYNKAIQLVNFDSSCNTSMVKILESYIPEEVKDTNDVEILEDLEDVESTCEDINSEDKDEI